MSLPDAQQAEAPVSTTELATDAWEALFRAQVSVMRRLSADDVWDRVTMREYDVLFTLSLAPRNCLRLHDLNREILLSQPSLSRLVERLEGEGLVSRSVDPRDRRGTIVQLTEAGAALQKSVGRRHAASIRRHVGPALDTDELRLLAELCTRLRLAQA
ncbi:MarR family transcriptional regulator [Rhodococcus sp. IEGM 1409]|uniref:MarR family winged helix-turn-helix transcriptional regulator n=1 Tax=Rhodococcus sp. IEGM 1409 TaxID=3047082 RepID=UPI0024B64C05|nr:MarR family transcriptional regulator [Rhodococcus sp. IEGM 1409]MDI9901417.1 MarR family transcriptional regulator [Rhodococcus sp. IEGM 1409]